MGTDNFKTDTVVTISGGRYGNRTQKLETWKFWEIVGELVWRGAERWIAEDNAKWCMKAPSGAETSIYLKLRERNLPNILLKVR